MLKRILAILVLASLLAIQAPTTPQAPAPVGAEAPPPWSDMVYTINWSRVYPEDITVGSPMDFSGDGVNDTIIITRGGSVQIIDPVHNRTLIEYRGGMSLASIIPVDDYNNDGLNDTLLVYADNTLVKTVLLQPAAGRIAYERTYPVSLRGEIQWITFNTVYRGGRAEITIPTMERTPTSASLYTYILEVDAETGELTGVTRLNNTMYTIRGNEIPVDMDENGVPRLNRSIEVEANSSIIQGMPPAISTEVRVRVGGITWRKSLVNYMAAGAAVLGDTLALFLAHYSQYTIDAIVIQGYSLTGGAPRYTIAYSYETHRFDSLSLAGRYIIVNTVLKENNTGYITVYNARTGAEEKSISIGEAGAILTTMTIGRGEGGDYLFLAANSSRLYLASTTRGLIDYLGEAPGDIILIDGNVIDTGGSKMYTIEVDEGGRHVAEAISLTLNTTAYTEIIWPANNSLVEAPLKVRAYARGGAPVLEVTANGSLVAEEAMQGIGGGFYEATISLGDGCYTLRTRVGATYSKPVVVHVDNTPPELGIEKPHDGDYVKPSITLLFKTSDPHLANTTIYVNYHRLATLDTQQLAEHTIDGLVEYKLDLSQYPDGPIDIAVESTDKLGHTTREEIRVYKDSTPPTINATPETTWILVFPSGAIGAPAEYAEKPYRLHVSIQDNLLASRAAIFVNGTPIETIDIGSRGAEETVGLRLGPGSNNITITAQDAAGNTRTTTIIVLVNTARPTISINSVETRDGTVYCRVEARTGAPGIPLAKIVYRVYRAEGGELVATATREIGVEEYGGEQSISVGEDGRYVIEATVYDATGNNATATATLTIDTSPPVIEVEKLETSGSSVYIEWRVLDSLSGVERVLIIVDGSTIDATGRTSITLSLSPGAHNITIIAYDRAGNKAVENLGTVEAGGGAGATLLAAAIAAAVALAILYILYRRGKLPSIASIIAEVRRRIS